MKRIFGLWLFLLALTGLVNAFAREKPARQNGLPAVHDTGDQGPAEFYYEAYEQQPWRLPQSPMRLMKKSGYLIIVSGALYSYIRLRRKRT